jgi:hypothetical protein
MIARKSLAAAGALALLATIASAQQFNGGIPAGWICVGVCGTLGANGVVPLAPGGGTQYGFVTTAGGQTGVRLNGSFNGSETDGSMLTSSGFAAGAGDVLSFNFNYVTSDGAGFADYAWARLLDASFNQVAILFTARTVPAPGDIVPGSGMPLPAATLTPSSVPIQPGTTWSPLAGSSGGCFDSGCGNSGWVQAQFTIGTAGTYFLEFGVVNWLDFAFDSGFAFDGLSLNDVPIGGGAGPVSATPEPATLFLVGTGLIGVAGIARRRRKGDVEAP